MTVGVNPVELHHQHRDVSGGWLRAAVFGAMDGLVSNGALIAGMIGGGATGSTVTLAALAGLTAGASSMAAGEYTSVASQSEAARAEIEVERREIARHPEEEKAELAEMYASRGVDPELARQVAEQIHRDDAVALRIHVLEELGVDAEDLPSPWVAAGSSFAAFAVGALIPVLPLLLGAASVLPVVLVTLGALFATGAVVTVLTGRSPWFGGTRQLLLGVLAALFAFGVGHLFGVGVS
ncbi:VIT1/CCC1 transporter family protein [Phytoactinopolyspora halotolerans]|uniref:VIT family protein n=1 Tax=Phytoactinopolyspora halotolerans TaxID=1981512 RepID=A0A6L9SB17_9ACTN|nr:VIT1/CCC1 transporter family protein [Phytoactinopolyspora halotolerans]NEE02243.1 hypothetical protein [Phytoactinopolyspora halotolerans]